MLKRFKNRLIAKLLTANPSLADRLVKGSEITPLGVDLGEMPWTQLAKPLSEARVALVTTAGVHLKNQTPFDMDDFDGDPTMREIPSSVEVDSLTITHDYYDHTDADRDINIVFPIDRLRELKASGFIGDVAPRFFGLMGHISGRHIKTLYEETASRMAAILREDKVDVVVLTPG